MTNEQFEEIKTLILKISEDIQKHLIQWSLQDEKVNLENKIQEPIKTIKRTKI